MNTKKEYQKPQTEVIDLQLEAPVMADSNQKSTLNYNSGTGRGSEDAVNSFWNKNNFIE